MTRILLTIGHSNHPADVFVRLLGTHAVTVLVDVRSAPYSRFHPQFNRAALAGTLGAAGIEYVYLGNTLGGRPADPALYEGGRVRYERVARTAAFRDAVGQVAERAARDRPALMCAEREPLACHRTLLVAPALEARGAAVAHILADGALEPHEDTMDRLLAKHGLARTGDLLGTRADAIATAISRETGRGTRRRAPPRS